MLRPVDVGAGRPIVLSGAMGAGKTTVGAALASQLGWAHVDLDDEVAGRFGASSAEVFHTLGERRFRAVESAVLRDVLAAGRVVSLGGGTLLDAGNRAFVAERSRWVHLRVSSETAWARTDGGGTRPLRGTVDEFRHRHAARESSGADAGCHVDAESSVETVVAAILDAVEATPAAEPLDDVGCRWQLGDGPERHEVLCSAFGVRVLADRLRGARRVLVVVDPRIGSVARRSIVVELASVAEVVVVERPGGEGNKDLRALEELLDSMFEAGVERGDPVVVVGGGAVLDLGGLAASLCRRGLDFHLVPSTLLAMADASVGGKVAVDHRRGKNLIGLFRAPRSVQVCTALLRTLPPRQRRAGLVEALKMAALYDREAWARWTVAPGILDDEVLLRDVVEGSITMKARVVMGDWNERGPRRLLNFGHTLGHALEASMGFRDILHGEAVAIGMVAELRVGVALGLTEPSVLDAVTEGLRRIGAPTEPIRLVGDSLVEALLQDKKWSGGRLRWPVLDALGSGREAPLPSHPPEDLCRMLVQSGFVPAGDRR